ncbi:MAG: hypothetical protein AB7G17_08510 [Phycisphaerales bacterium]
MIAYFPSDLLWATRIKSTAEALGLSARPVRSVDMVRERFGDSPVTSVIVDLAGDVALGLEIIRAARACEAERVGATTGSGVEDRDPRGGGGDRVRIVAFGPHVDREALQGARDAGADEVMPRGAFSNHLPDLLLRLESR